MPLIARLLLSILCIANCLAFPLAAAGGSCSTIELAMLLESEHGRLVKIASLLIAADSRRNCIHVCELVGAGAPLTPREA